MVMKSKGYTFNFTRKKYKNRTNLFHYVLIIVPKTILTFSGTCKILVNKLTSQKRENSISLFTTICIINS